MAVIGKRWLIRSVPKLVEVACWTALIALAIMGTSIVWPSVLPVILAMSVGHVVGVAALACYLFAVILDSRRPPRPSESPSSNAPKRSS